VRKIKHKSRKNKKRRGNPISRGLAKVTDSLYSVASSSATGRALNEYDGGERAFGKSFLLGKIKTFFKNIDTKKLKYAFGKSVEQSKIVHVYSRIIDVLLTSLVRQYGVCVFSLGLYTLLIYFLGSYAVDIFDVSLLHFGVGAAEVICSIPMLASRKTLAAALKESRAADLILFNILGISSESLERERGVSSPMGVIPIILGLVAGLATTFISPVTILLSVLTVICLCIGLCAPESALVLVIALSPFMSEGVLQAAVFYLLISYILKVLRGK